MKKIAFLGYHTDTNLGDPLICQTVEYLFKQSIPEPTEWVPINIRDCFDCERTKRNKRLEWIFVFLRKVSHHIPWNGFYDWRVRLAAKAIENTMGDVDWGIVAGGGVIHYTFHESWLGVCAFIRACKKKQIPVAMNAVGVEGFDIHNHKCQLLYHYLNEPTVHYISTRDDFDSLKQYIAAASPIRIEKTVDPAIFCSSLFNNTKDEQSQTIGIGLIRKNILRDYKSCTVPIDLVEYYAQLYQGILEKGFTPSFFTNGNEEDLDIVPDIEKKLGHSIEVSVPSSLEQLISIITSYKGIITARMHSCIIAYSYRVPAVAFVWNEKIAFWGRRINQPDNFIPISALNAPHAINILMTNFTMEDDAEWRRTLETQCLESIQQAVHLLYS